MGHLHMLFVCLPRTPTLSDAYLLHAPTKEQAEHEEEERRMGEREKETIRPMDIKGSCQEPLMC